MLKPLIDSLERYKQSLEGQVDDSLPDPRFVLLESYYWRTRKLAKWLARHGKKS